MEETKLPVFEVLGFGGTASQPKEIYVFPLQNLKYGKLKKSYMANFKRMDADKGFFFDLEKKKLINQKVKKIQKDGASEDICKGTEDEIQGLTDKHIALIDKNLEAKEKEIMTV